MILLILNSFNYTQCSQRTISKARNICINNGVQKKSSGLLQLKKCKLAVLPMSHGVEI